MTIGSADFLSRFQLFDAAGVTCAHVEAVPSAGPLALAASDPPNGRILVVEPQAIIALDIQRILRDAGYHVVGPATSAAEVAPLLRRGRPECALIGLDPHTDDLTTVAKLLDGAAVPCVVLGSDHGLGSCRALEKPFTGRELVEAIKDAIAVGGEPIPPQAASLPMP
jgi:chemotaxis response regulator CheB